MRADRGMLSVMWKTPRAGLAPPAPLVARSGLLPVLLLVALVAGLTACTDDSGQGGPASSGTATGDAPSLHERAAPYDVHYRRVAGDIRKARGGGALQAVSAPVRAWIDAGFVQGPWPRQAFGQAFASFGRDITASAHRDADLLTLQPEGGSFVDVVPQRREVGVSVTGVKGRVVGATARVHVRVLGVSGDGERTAVSVSGDVFLTHVESHGWRIFGYQLDRWVGRGAMTASKSRPHGKPDSKSKGKPGSKQHSNGKTRGGS